MIHYLLNKFYFLKLKYKNGIKKLKRVKKIILLEIIKKYIAIIAEYIPHCKFIPSNILNAFK